MGAAGVIATAVVMLDDGRRVGRELASLYWAVFPLKKIAKTVKVLLLGKDQTNDFS